MLRNPDRFIQACHAFKSHIDSGNVPAGNVSTSKSILAPFADKEEEYTTRPAGQAGPWALHAPIYIIFWALYTIKYYELVEMQVRVVTVHATRLDEDTCLVTCTSMSGEEVARCDSTSVAEAFFEFQSRVLSEQLQLAGFEHARFALPEGILIRQKERKMPLHQLFFA